RCCSLIRRQEHCDRRQGKEPGYDGPFPPHCHRDWNCSRTCVARLAPNWRTCTVGGNLFGVKDRCKCMQGNVARTFGESLALHGALSAVPSYRVIRESTVAAIANELLVMHSTMLQLRDA